MRVMRWVADYGIFAAFGILFLFLAVTKPDEFLSLENLGNIPRQNAVTIILARLMLHERLGRVQKAGLVVAGIGVALMAPG